MRISTSLTHMLAVNRMLDQQSGLLKTQQQLATGQRILTPSDDPAGATQALQYKQAMAALEQYQSNGDAARLRLAHEESMLQSVTDVLQHVRERAVQGANGSQTAESRAAIAREVRQSLDELLRLANTADGNGEYLFAGYQSKTQPFSRSGDTFTYHGDAGRREVRIGPARTLQATTSGADVFLNLPDGNGRFVTDVGTNTVTGAANSGTGVIGTGQVVDPSNYQGTESETYTIRFSESDGEVLYEVTRDSDAASVGNGTYSPGDAIVFEGRDVVIDGMPADGDTFTVAPSTDQTLFDSVQRLAAALESGTGPAPQTGINRALAELDTALGRVLDVQADIGARLNAIDTEFDANEAALLDLEEARSGVEDLDYAEAISRMNLELVGLQAAQQSFIKIQGLSLFNYLR